MSNLLALDTMPDFLLNAPLYEKFKLQDIQVAEAFYKNKLMPFDGFCPHCHKETTYSITQLGSDSSTYFWHYFPKTSLFEKLVLTCSRNDRHKLTIFFYISEMTIQKVGQLPSLADVANSEVKKYRKIMSDLDGAEFHKAVGLAAHGVGVGSFVYLRRVFERLIYTRFAEFKEENKWDEKDFKSKRMDEKIAFLKGHLPSFLVKKF